MSGDCSHEFGDAEIASLIAPRALIVEASRGPEIEGPPPSTKERNGATPNGRLDNAASRLGARRGRARSSVFQSGSRPRISCGWS